MTIPPPHAGSMLSNLGCGISHLETLLVAALHKNLTVEEAEPWDAPQEESPAQIAPLTSMNLPAGTLIVVPALMVNFAPSATTTSSVNV